MRILILGGYGNFGARIARALCDPDSGASHVRVAGRDAAKARAFADQLGPHCEGLALDPNGADLAARLEQLEVQCVIHTAGPFQAQGYVVARAAAAARAHYIDLADGRRFVCDFPAALDPAFRAADRVAISGASTVPALSSAVVAALTRGWTRIDTIDVCIAPAQSAPRGLATLAAVLSYCGAPIRVWRDGRWQERSGWAQPERIRFARLRPRRGALCDVPDLELFPAHFRVTRSVMFRAALEVAPTQWGFAAIALARRLGVLRHPERLAPLLQRAAGFFDRFGSALGGMLVCASGRDEHDRAVARSWHLTAPDGHGPEIPCMPAILFVRRLAATRSVAAALSKPAMRSGAHAAVNLLELNDFEAEFARWGMLTELGNGLNEL